MIQKMKNEKMGFCKSSKDLDNIKLYINKWNKSDLRKKEQYKEDANREKKRERER